MNGWGLVEIKTWRHTHLHHQIEEDTVTIAFVSPCCHDLNMEEREREREREM